MVPVTEFVIDEQHRFRKLVCGVWVAMLVGVTYAFGLLTNQMKMKFHLSQEELSQVTTIGFSLAFFCLPAGIVWDFFGPRATLGWAGTMTSVGFFLLGLSFLEKLPHSVPMLATEMSLICMGTAWMDIGSLMTNLFNFPVDRGDIVIIQKTFMGLGSTMFAAWYVAFFPDEYVAYCFFIAGIVVVVSIIGAVFITLPPYQLTHQQRNMREKDAEVVEQSHAAGMKGEVLDDVALKQWDLLYHTQRAARWRLLLGKILLGASICVLTTFSFITAYTTLSRSVHIAIGCIVLALALSFASLGVLKTNPLANTTLYPKLTEQSGSAVDDADEDDDKDGEEIVVESPTTLILQSKGKKSETARSVFPYKQYTTRYLHSMQKPTMWLLLYYCFALWGSGVLLVVNSAQIYRALNHDHYDASHNSLYVALIGLGSALGRVVLGTLEKVLVHKNMSITILLPFTSALMAISIPMFLLLPSSAMGVPFFWSSFAYGGSWALIVLIVRMLFKEDTGKHYNTLFSSAILAMILLNSVMFGKMYDAEGKAQHLYPHCSGTRCVSVGFWVLSALNAVGVLAAMGVHWLWEKNQFTVPAYEAE